MQIAETEQRWVDYENDETQIKLDLADLATDWLLGETVEKLTELAGRLFVPN